MKEGHNKRKRKGPRGNDIPVATSIPKAQMILVSKYCTSLKEIRAPWRNGNSDLEQAKYKISLIYLVPESKKEVKADGDTSKVYSSSLKRLLLTSLKI